ncbi:MAG: ATP-binding cassette domain-containing protein, partial [Myxococcales bacterium]|nr:ATP-binding cassette domain-containing protein [Myxococcales bacterium]
MVSNVDLTVSAGKVLVIAGENGAGKTTALRVLAGLVRPDSGEVEVAGARAVEASPRAARAAGVALVAQHFSLVEGLSALENVVLSAPPKGPWGAFRADLARQKVEAILSRLGARVDLASDVAVLGVGERQRLELARALYADAKVLLLDEPTAILSPREADDLYGILHDLAAEGRAVAVVSHKLDEIRRHADAVTVLRRGEVTLDEPLSRGAVDAETMARVEHAILGGATARLEPAPPRERGAAVATLTRASVGRLRELELVVSVGEIVGVAGVAGNGQEELVHLLAGAVGAESGSVSLPAQVAVVHEDRHREGLCLDVPLRDNVLLGEHARYSRFGLLDAKAMDAEARRRLEAVRVRGSGDALEL